MPRSLKDLRDYLDGLSVLIFQKEVLLMNLIYLLLTAVIAVVIALRVIHWHQSIDGDRD
jgi:hypothetical protein